MVCDWLYMIFFNVEINRIYLELRPCAIFAVLLLPSRGQYFLAPLCCQPVDSSESEPELAAQCEGIYHRDEKQVQ